MIHARDVALSASAALSRVSPATRDRLCEVAVALLTLTLTSNPSLSPNPNTNPNPNPNPKPNQVAVAFPVACMLHLRPATLCEPACNPT
eukprot:scaffold7886_cov41-Phaeocystis_antarctica.AAC.1